MLKHFLLILCVLSLTQASVDECVPKQLYSALGSSYYYVSQPYESSNLEDNDAIIMFTTKDECAETVLELLDPSQKSVTIRPWEVVNFTANYTDGLYHNFIHIFYLFNLVQGQEYTYRAVSSIGNTTNSSYLKLPLAVESNQTSKTNSYLVIGDWDYGVVTAATWNALRALINETSFKDFSHIVFLGDMAYDLEDRAGQVGDEYFEQISQSIARYLPFMTIPGNHETAYNYSNYNNRIRSPLWEETNNHYYSYNSGLIHWISFDFDFYSMNPNLVPAMLKWLAEDLKTANENRDRWPWIVFLNHRPLYCSHLLDSDCTDNANKYSQVETILYENSVDLYLSGHVHSYERMLPIYRNEVAQFDTRTLDTRYEQIVNPQAPIHILEGIGGASKDGKLPTYGPLDFSVVVDFDLGYGVLNCHNKTHLEYIHYRSEDNKVVDKMVIVKDRVAYSHDLIE